MLELTMQNFNSVVENNHVVVIDFMASWCGPCKMFGPIFEQVSRNFPNVVFAKVDIDKSPQIARHFKVGSVPTVGIAVDNRMVFQQSGVMNANQLAQKVNQYTG